MLVLAIDTAGENCSAILAEDGWILAKAEAVIGKGHAEILPNQIKKLMSEGGREFSDIDRIGVNIGPGSFTGARVGVAAARALALALDIDAAGISAFDALYMQAMEILRKRRQEPAAVLAVLSAPQNSFYTQYFSAEGAADEDAADAPRHMTAAEAAAFAAEKLKNEKPFYLICSGAADLAARLSEKDAAKTEILNAGSTADIVCFALCAMAKEDSELIDPPAPLYMRPPDAKPQIMPPLAEIKQQFRAEKRADSKPESKTETAA